jgi:cyclopropane fatty-acyl-phospholipid synthase-like methyltransferase
MYRNISDKIFALIESGVVPDFITRIGIRKLLSNRVEQCEMAAPNKVEYIKGLKERNIALNTQEANEQHYEVPTEFFKLSLGPNLKYSCCLFEDTEDLGDAELKMLDLYAKRAQIEDGMSILELGCGWGSLTLYLAKKYPNSNITGLSNSKTQKIHIMDRAQELGLTNIEIITADLNEHQMEREFDRVVTIEMFEHMKNYNDVFEKVSKWIKPDTGRMFVHVFCHKDQPYDFRTEDDNSWMAKYFFTGGTMPSQDLFLWFQENVTVCDRWDVNGTHYAKTSEAWLVLQDKNKGAIMPHFEKIYGKKEAELWFERWRIFYLAVAETFNYNNGTEWFVTHYLLKRK